MKDDFFCDENVFHFSGEKQIKEKVQVPRRGRWRANVGRQVYKTIIALLLVLFGYWTFFESGIFSATLPTPVDLKLRRSRNLQPHVHFLFHRTPSTK